MITEEDVTRFSEIRRDMEDIVRKASVSRVGFTPLMRRATGEPCDYAPIFGDIECAVLKKEWECVQCA